MTRMTQTEWGAIEFSEEFLEDWEVGDTRTFRFVPGERVRGRLPADFEQSFNVVLGSDGIRRIIPAGAMFKQFLYNAALLGQTIAEANGLFSPEQVGTSDSQRLLFQQQDGIRERFSRSFTKAADLRIAKRGRSAIEDRNILPDDLGVNTRRLSKWSVSELLKQGERQATLWEISVPDDARKIQCGLYRAAIDSPMPCDAMSDLELRHLMRILLFDCNYEQSSIDVFAEADRRFDQVRERFAVALCKKLDAGTDRFNHWFFEESDTFIKQIAQQVQDGGAVPREVVREIRIRTILEAYQWMSQCIHIAMQAVQNLLPIDLTEAESEYFGLLYRRQRHLGELSLILIRDRLNSIGVDPLTALTCQLELPVLLKVMKYHTDMSVNRRRADRNYKRNGGAECPSTKSTALDAFLADPNAGSDLERLVDTEHVDAIVATIAGHCQVRCDCPEQGRLAIDDRTSNDNDEVVISLACRVCEYAKEVTLTADLQERLKTRFGIL